MAICGAVRILFSQGALYMMRRILMETNMIAVVGGIALLILVALAGADLLVSNISSDELTKMGVERKS